MSRVRLANERLAELSEALQLVSEHSLFLNREYDRAKDGSPQKQKAREMMDRASRVRRFLEKEADEVMGE